MFLIIMTVLSYQICHIFSSESKKSRIKHKRKRR